MSSKQSNPPTLDELKKARTSAKRALTLQIANVREILAIDDPAHDEELSSERHALVRVFREFKASHNVYVDNLVEQSEPGEQLDLELEKQANYYATEQSCFTIILEKVRDRFGIDNELSLIHI